MQKEYKVPVDYDPEYYEYMDISYMADFPNFGGFAEGPTVTLSDGRTIEVHSCRVPNDIATDPIGMKNWMAQTSQFFPAHLVRKLKLVDPKSLTDVKGVWFFRFGALR